MNITARVYCETVIQQGSPANDKLGALDGGVHSEQVTFKAIYSSSKDDPNRTFSAATPNLNLTMTITNKSALGAFVPGHIYDITFSPTPARTPQPF